MRLLRSAFSLILVAGACASNASAAPTASESAPAAIAKPAPLATDAASLAHADRDFALRLYATQQSASGNLFFSPASARVALAMTYAGARGETATQMAKTLGFTKDAAQVAADYGAILRAWNANADAKVKLNVVNRLWGRQARRSRPRSSIS